MSRLIHYLIFGFLALLVWLFAMPAKAAMCFIDAPNGTRYYRMAGKPTLNLSGKVATVKPCNAEGLQVETNTVTASCMDQAQKACHPHWGAIPIYATPPADACSFYYLTTKDSNGDSTTLRYLNGQIFDGSQSVNGEPVCPKK